MKIYLLIFHLLSCLYLAGGCLISMSMFFKVNWSDEVKSYAQLWQKLALAWGILFIPLFVWGRDLFPWAEFLGNKKFYFSQGFVLGRIVVFWLGGVIATRLFHKLPALCLILFTVIGTVFAIDWGMSLEGHWNSNLYGPMYLVNGLFAVFALILIRGYDRLSETSKRDAVHLLFAFSVIWGYLHYSHFLIMWMANKPHEIVFFLRRKTFEWPLIIITIITLKFIPIFAVALSKKLKMQGHMVKIASGCILAGFVLEVIWFITPEFYIKAFS